MPEIKIVKCIKLNKELPGLDKPPIPGETGKMVYENVSKEAFKMFLDHFKIIMNEYRLDLTNTETDRIFEQQMKEYFFGQEMNLPDEYTPPEK